MPRQILRVVKVRAIWWGKEPCSFERQSIFWWNIENWRILILYVLFSFQVDLHLFLPLLNWWESLLCRMKYSCNKFRQMYKAKQKRSTEGCSKFKGPETRQVQERLVSTLEHMQVPKWDRTRCPEPSQLRIEFYLVVLKRQRVHV